MVNKSGVWFFKKHTLPQWLVYYIIVMPFLLSFLQDFLGIPDFIRYTIDLAWVLSIAIIFFRKQVVIDRKLIPILIFISILLIYTFTVYMLNYQSVLYYLWGFRNNFRFYFAFVIFAVYFTEEDANTCFKILDIFFWINAVVTFVQFFALGYKQDYLGGIFGVDIGCNSYTTIFFTIIVSKSVLMFMNRQEKFWLCFAKFAVALIISAMAELKAFFIIFVFIVLLSSIFTSFAWRKFWVLIVSAFLMFFASSIITALFGEGSAISFQQLIEIATSDTYSSASDLGRFTAIPIISDEFLTEWYQKLFGLGLGNCETSNFALFSTPFFQSYGYLHYYWFSSAFLFLETGYMGLLIYISFFVICFITAFNYKKRKLANELHCQMSMIMSIICVLVVFYNASLRSEVGYMAYFVLSLPLISRNSYLSNSNKTQII